MKFYETHYEEYIQSLEQYNMHPELVDTIESFPKHITEFGNMILYGPVSSGKYTQLLNIIRRYSPSHLKYDKKIEIQTDKQNYIYRISDIHYEIDMSLLGCNSKIVWHELYCQIIDIISMKTDKHGIIVCKNFHMIHNELLDVFYSYMQPTNSPIRTAYEVSPQFVERLYHSNIHVYFMIVTEHVSFIPNNILNSCKLLRIARPSKENYMKMIEKFNSGEQNSKEFEEKVTISKFFETSSSSLRSPNFSNTYEHRRPFPASHSAILSKAKKIKKILAEIDTNSIMNTKELYSFALVDAAHELPSDIFNIICDNIIQQMIQYKKIEFTNFRDDLYDILIYNLEITDCIWYILHYFIQNDYFSKKSDPMNEILSKIYTFLKYYNNNYRPIYHLESIFFYLLIQIHEL